MFNKTVKRGIRRFGHSLGLWTDWEQRLAAINSIQGVEKEAGWYDEVFAAAKSYHCHYTQSCYYFSWSVIADRILRDRLGSVLEIGCGPGQFAEMLWDYGIRNYMGLDFSAKAVEIAKTKAPRFQFLVDDARRSSIYSEFAYDVIVCTEVLEHIDDDLLVVSRFLPSKRCLCTVPNFPFESHVRHFTSVEEVIERYGSFFHKLSVSALRGTRSPTEVFYLLDGVRNERTV